MGELGLDIIGQDEDMLIRFLRRTYLRDLQGLLVGDT